MNCLDTNIRRYFTVKTLQRTCVFVSNANVCAETSWCSMECNTPDRIYGEFSALETKSSEMQFWCDCIRTIIDEMLCGKVFRHQRDSVGKDQVRQIEHAYSISEKEIRTPSSRHHLVISYFHALNWAAESQKGMCIHFMSTFKSLYFLSSSLEL